MTISNVFLESSNGSLSMCNTGRSGTLRRTIACSNRTGMSDYKRSIDLQQM